MKRTDLYLGILIGTIAGASIGYFVGHSFTEPEPGTVAAHSAVPKVAASAAQRAPSSPEETTSESETAESWLAEYLNEFPASPEGAQTPKLKEAFAAALRLNAPYNTGRVLELIAAV